MTIVQIYAIVALLLAFNVPKPTVDMVQAILTHANKPVDTVLIQPAPVQGGIGGFSGSVMPVQKTPDPITETATSSPVVASLVDIKVNGSDGPLVVPVVNCRTTYGADCANVIVSWTSKDTISPGCGIEGTPVWSGNWGSSGNKQTQLTPNETNSYLIKITCLTLTGYVSDSVSVTLSTSTQN